jgi:hypothetical protein
LGAEPVWESLLPSGIPAAELLGLPKTMELGLLGKAKPTGKPAIKQNAAQGILRTAKPAVLL